MTDYTSEPPNTTTKLDLSESSSACPNKMGEGGNVPFHCPLPKMLVLSEEESLKLNINQRKENSVALPVPDKSSQWATYICNKSLYLTPIGIIIPDDCDLLTVLLFPDSV